METCIDNTHKERWGDKTPGHEIYLDRIFDIYPEAKILFMIRDPRAVSASLKKYPGIIKVYGYISKDGNKA